MEYLILGVRERNGGIYPPDVVDPVCWATCKAQESAICSALSISGAGLNKDKVTDLFKAPHIRAGLYLAAATVAGVITAEFGNRPPHRVVTADGDPGLVFGQEIREP